MKALFSMCLLLARSALAISVHDLQNLNKEQVTKALEREGFDPLVLQEEGFKPAAYQSIKISSRTTKNVPFTAEKYQIQESQLTGMFTAKLNFFESHAQYEGVILPDHAFIGKRTAAFVTLKASEFQPSPAVSATFKDRLGHMSVLEYKTFMNNLMRIFRSLEDQGMVFLKVLPSEIGVSSGGDASPVILTTENLLPVGFHCNIESIENTPDGPRKVQESFLKQLFMGVWQSTFPSAPKQARMANTLQEEMKLIYDSSSANKVPAFVFGDKDNIYYVVKVKRNWNRINFLALLKENPVTAKPKENLAPYVEMLASIYGKLEQRKLDEVSWEKLEELIDKLPSSRVTRRSRTPSPIYRK